MGRYCPHSTWLETMANREIALAKRHIREKEKWQEHTKSLPDLRVGDHVFLQNLTGNHPKRWERTGTIVEVRQFHQYVVKIDGSGRLTLRNRQHLRKYVPFSKPTRDEIVESLSPAMQSGVGSPQPEVVPAAAEHPSHPVDHPEEPPSPPPSPPPSNHLLPDADDRNNDGVDDSPISSPCPIPSPKVARALARLRPHNAPGNLESPSALSGRRLRSHRKEQ